MAEHRSILPLEAVSGFWKVDLEHIKSDIEKLPKTLTMFLICKLNSLCTEFGDEENLDQYQLHALRLLYRGGYADRETILRIRAYGQKFGTDIFFSRAHCFEMLKYLSLWGKACEFQKQEFRTKNVQRALLRAIVTSFEFHSQRTQLWHLNEIENLEELDFQLLPVYRSLSLEAHSTTPIFSILGRGPAFLDKYFFEKHVMFLEAFQSTTKMTLQDYRDCALNLLSLIISKRPMEIQSVDQAYEFTAEGLCSALPTKIEQMKRFIDLESMTPDYLANGVSSTIESGLIDFRLFRPKPLLKESDGEKFTIIDISLLAERATYGPFFHVGKTEAFKEFGLAFECYLQDEFDRLHHQLGFRESPLRNPHGKKLGGKDQQEVADSALISEDALVLIQVKGSWLNDDHIALSANEYWEKVKEKYGVSAENGKKKGIAQLGFSIKRIIDGDIIIDFPFTQSRRIYPILFVHDSHLSIELFSYFFARDFCNIFGIDSISADSWFKYKDFDICAVIVMALDDFELIECLKQKNLLELLDAYTRWDNKRKSGFRNFMVNYWQRYIGTTSLYESAAAKAGLQYTAEMIKRWFSQADADRFIQSTNNQFNDAN